MSETVTRPFEPIQRRKLYQEVVDRLVERISSGMYRPGDKLPSERELMTQFGVGRPAVREAMQSLELHYPAVEANERKHFEAMRQQLRAEG